MKIKELKEVRLIRITRRGTSNENAVANRGGGKQRRNSHTKLHVKVGVMSEEFSALVVAPLGFTTALHFVQKAVDSFARKEHRRDSHEGLV